MHRIVGGIVLLLLAWPARADDKPKDNDKPATPAEQYQALAKEYNDAQRAMSKAYREAKTNEDRQKVLKEMSPRPEKYAPKFLELAEKNPKDAVAVDALLWIVRFAPAPAQAKDAPRNKAIAILSRDHVASPKMSQACQSLAYSDDEGSKQLLRAVLEKNPDASVQAEACLALAQGIRQEADTVKRVQKDEKTAKVYEQYYGKEKVDAMKKVNLAKLEAESDGLFKQIADKYLGKMQPQQVSNLCQRLARNTDKGSELVLRKILNSNMKDQREAQGVACLYLAQLLKNRAEEMSEKEAKDMVKVQKESEQLFERALKEFADVKAGFLGTVGRHAESELFELRFLSKGKPAPEIEAEDLGGMKFKLSDYRGKVVLIDFWGHW